MVTCVLRWKAVASRFASWREGGCDGSVDRLPRGILLRSGVGSGALLHCVPMLRLPQESGAP
eukprot:12893785-Prorocentrum_lima.AAC.1